MPRLADADAAVLRSCSPLHAHYGTPDSASPNSTRYTWQVAVRAATWLLYFFILRIRPASSSRFRLPRMWVPSCESNPTGTVVRGAAKAFFLLQMRSLACLSTGPLTEPAGGSRQRCVAHLPLGHLQGALILANLQKLHDALLVGGQAGHIANHLADELDALAKTLQSTAESPVSMNSHE